MSDPIDADDAHDAEDVALGDVPDISDVPGANPLEDLFGGGGMPDLGSLVDGLSAVQTLQSATYVGTAGGGLVRITANGRMDVERV